jgi:4-alpha-glucanotransferase
LAKTTQKAIGTLVPMSAIFSSKTPQNDTGTFAAGLIFLDWLKETQQSVWQMLPLHETQLEKNSTTIHIPSPYKSYGIGLHPQYLPTTYAQKSPTSEQKELFIKQNQDWIADYALFCSLRDYFGIDDWRVWDKDVRLRNKEALIFWEEKLIDKIDFYITQQWQLDQSYAQVRSKAKALGITLVGDLSFYISVKSPLVWVYQDCFQIEKDGSTPLVSGIPDINKTYFGRQIWGHPLYKWESLAHKEKLITLWKTRIRYQARLFDHIRLDHANGLFHYGIIHVEDAKKDCYKKGPGIDVFNELIHYCHSQNLGVFVEDSGEMSQALLESLHVRHIPGIKVFSFSFAEKSREIDKQFAQIANYSTQTIAYTSTHDSKTLLGFLESLDTKQKEILAQAGDVDYSSDNKKFATILRTAILQSSAKMVIISIQDWLLTTDRINIPGTELQINDPNWHFQVKIPIENLPTNVIPSNIILSRV